MAKLKKPVTADHQKILEAFSLYVTMDDKLQRVYTLRQIAQKIGVSMETIIRWKKEDQWEERLDSAILKAREKASGPQQLKDLLTFHLFGDAKPKSLKCLDEAAIVQKLEKAKAKRLRDVIRYMSDIIVETREYNLLAASLLRGKKVKRVPKAMRGAAFLELHRAWLDSLTKLLELFGVSTIKSLAYEILADEMLRKQLNADSPKPNIDPKVAVTLNVGGNQSVGVNDNIVGGSPVVLTGDAHEVVMKIMVGETKIDGPVGYTGPKAQGKIDGIEDAIIKPGDPDSGGEE